MLKQEAVSNREAAAALEREILDKNRKLQQIRAEIDQSKSLLNQQAQNWPAFGKG